MHKPVADARPNTYAFETVPLVKPTGFREYDARWWFGHPASSKPPELNLLGVQALGMGLGTLIRRLGAGPGIVTGHDYRSYSMAIKLALTQGLMAAGAHVKDIGLALSPMAYFAQFALETASVAMVTASHNDNGWTGVKMGCQRPLTFGPDEMAQLRDIVLSGDFDLAGGGSYEAVAGMRERYLSDLADGIRLKRRLKVVAACGNGTAGAFAPDLLERIGCEVIPLDCNLDHAFPRYNPNPEDMEMLHAIRDAVLAHKADVGLGFDGDGDRCGVVDDECDEIFADKVGVIMARDLAPMHPGATFVADVKSTGLFASDPELLKHGIKADYWKTGHSHMKRRVAEIGALAGFEKSGHYFLAEPIGRGYDDGMRVAVEMCKVLDRNPSKSMSDLKHALPKTWSTPTMSPFCPDGEKYQVLERLQKKLVELAESGGKLAGRDIKEVITVNGARLMLDNGAWGLVRASSNTPNLVVVCESPESEAEMRAIFADLDAVIQTEPSVGEYDQKI